MTETPSTDAVAEFMAITASSSHLVSAAIVGALVERGLIDPFKVAAWAEMFASAEHPNLAPNLRDGVRDQLLSFANIIRSMATVPAGAGRG